MLLEDDIDGSEANQTVSFALDGAENEIDLSDGHANELREALERYTNARRNVSGDRARQRARKSPSQGGPDAKSVRRWAADNGIQVNTRGRIQAEVVEQYQAVR